MPFYSYNCSKCEQTYEVFHGMDEKMCDCEKCLEKDSLTRIPGNINVSSVSKTGQVVNEFINSVKEEMKNEKEKLTKQEYKK